MWFEMRPVGLDFLKDAPRVWVAECQLSAPRMAVWNAFADAASWPAWFPGVSQASYPGESPPYGVGTRRAASVAGQRYEERMVAWDEGKRWAYYIERATLPLANAQLECSEFEDHEGGTRVRWTLAADPRTALKVAAPAFQRVLDSLHRKAMGNLERYLSR
jgi:carbon monoxide dehydrogenase subunit G